MDDKKETKNDFEKALSKIDFSHYSPCSKDFDNALRIGLMWLILSNNPLGAKSEISEDDISEEFEGAKKYIEMFSATGEEAYRTMAQEELHHAEMLIKLAGKDMTQHFDAEKNKVSAMISKPLEKKT